MHSTDRDLPRIPDGRWVFRPGQALTSRSLNAIMTRMERLARGFSVLDGGDDTARILQAPSGPPARLVFDDSITNYRLQLSAFRAVVMGELLDLSTLPEAERRPVVPEHSADDEIVRIFLKIKHQRALIVPKGESVTEWAIADPEKTRPHDAFVLEVPMPELETDASVSEGMLEVARARLEDGKLSLVPDFVPAAATLGSISESLAILHRRLSPVFDLSDSAAWRLAERDDLSPSSRWKLAKLASAAREIRAVLANQGCRPADAYRIIATVLRDRLGAFGEARSEEPPVSPEARHADACLLSEMMDLANKLLAANKALVSDTAEFPRRRTGWVRLEADPGRPTRIRSITEGVVEITVELDRPLRQLAGDDCRRIFVAVRFNTPVTVQGPVLFHPRRTFDPNSDDPFLGIIPRGSENGRRFEFDVDLAGDSFSARNLDMANEVLDAERIRIVYAHRPEASAGEIEAGIKAFSGLVVWFRRKEGES